MVLYREVQGVLQPWLTALLAGPVVIVLFGLFQQVVLGRPWGNHPVSNRAFLLIAGALCLFVVWFLNLRLVTEVYPDTLVIGFPLLWPSRRVSFADIVSARAMIYRPIADYGGWGIRWNFSTSTTAYTAKGNRAVMLRLVDGRNVLLGSQTPEELELVLVSRPPQIAPRLKLIARNHSW